MEPEIREPKEDEIEAIQEMAANMSESENERFDPTIDPDWPMGEEADGWFRDRLGDDDGFVRVAVLDGRPIGYIVGTVREPDSYRSIDALAEAESMYVRPDHRGEGIGTTFMEAFHEWAQDQRVERTRVEVTAQNEAAIRFYQDNGFEDYAVILERDVEERF
jgi:GNAT superfamily N-acetyltransferase